MTAQDPDNTTSPAETWERPGGGMREGLGNPIADVTLAGSHA